MLSSIRRTGRRDRISTNLYPCGSMLRRLTPSQYGTVHQLSRTVELFSAKKSLATKKKTLKKPTVPAQFAKQLKIWPRLLQNEIDAQNEGIKELLAATRGDWTELEQRGMAVSGLFFIRAYFDPLDGCCVVLKRAGGQMALKRKALKEGAPVILADADTLERIAECVYLKTDDKNITLKLRVPKTLSDEKSYVILPSQEDGALQSLRDNLDIDKAAASPGAQLLNLAYHGAVMPSIHNDWNRSHISEDLNESQTKAVVAALNKKRPFVCIQGPPGTGKTRVVAEIIKLLSQKNQKILVCAPTHVAVDNAMNQASRLMEKEAEEKNKVLIEELSTTMDEAIEEHPAYFELKALSQLISTSDNQEIAKKGLLREYRKILRRISKDCYKRRRVICSTLGSSTVQKLASFDWEPDVIIIDEAAQCIEPAAWAAIIKAKRCILVGDHAQLPAIILSNEAEKARLNISLMERLCSDFSKSNISFLLSTQYRMNQTIMQWSSDTFYESRLMAAEEVVDTKLSDICLLPEEDMFNNPMIFIDTGSKQHFREEKHNASYRNFHEASLVSSYANFLLDHGLSQRSIGIISPYFAQVQMIKTMVSEQISTMSVDGFQGQEREVIIFSLVRNNPENNVGFLSESRRMNVAVTRAKRQFCLIGNRESLMRTRALKSLLRYIEKNGKVYRLQDLDFNNRTTKN